MDDMERIRRAVEGNDTALETAVNEHAREAPRRAPLDIARVVVVCYLLFLFAYLGYLFAKSQLLHVDVTGDITEMFKVFLLPLVMLVLGYYFGASRR